MMAEERNIQKEIVEIQTQIGLLEKQLKEKETRLVMVRQDDMIQRKNERGY